MTRYEASLYFATFTSALDRHGDASTASREAQIAVCDWHRFNRTSRLLYRVMDWLGLVKKS